MKIVETWYFQIWVNFGGMAGGFLKGTGAILAY